MLPEGGIIKIFLDFCVKPIHGEFLLIEFRNDLFPGNQVDEVIEGNVHQILAYHPSKVGNLEDGNKRSAENGCFQGCRTTGNHSQIGMSDDIVGVVNNDLKRELEARL